MADLTKLSDERLEAAQRAVMEKRAKAELELKAEARAIQDELDRRHAAARLAAVLDGLTDAERDALRAALEA